MSLSFLKFILVLKLETLNMLELKFVWRKLQTLIMFVLYIYINYISILKFENSSYTRYQSDGIFESQGKEK
jgi:hypothetical protein